MKIFKVQSPKKQVLISLDLSEAAMINAMLRSPENLRWVDGNILSHSLKSAIDDLKKDEPALSLEEQIILHLGSTEGLTATQIRQLLGVDFNKTAPAIKSLQQSGIIEGSLINGDQESFYRLSDATAALTAIDNAMSNGTVVEQLEAKILEILKQYPKQPKGFLAFHAGVKPVVLEPALQNLLQREEIIFRKKGSYAIYLLPKDDVSEKEPDETSSTEEPSVEPAKPRKKKRSKRPLVDRETAKRMRKEVYPCVELWCERLRVQSFTMSRLIAWIPWLSPYTAEQVCSADPRLAIYEGKYVGLK